MRNRSDSMMKNSERLLSKEREKLPFNYTINKIHNPSISITDYIANYNISLHNSVSDLMLSQSKEINDIIEKNMSRKIGEKLLQDSIEFLQPTGTEIFGMSVYVTPTLPKNVGLIIHPNIYARLLRII